MESKTCSFLHTLLLNMSIFEVCVTIDFHNMDKTAETYFKISSFVLRRSKKVIFGMKYGWENDRI